MKAIAEAALGLLKTGNDFVLSVVLESNGSTPRDVGAAMLVRRDGSIVGTIGGGVLEAHAERAARKVFDRQESVVAEFLLEEQGADAIGAICGGRAKVLVEYMSAQNPTTLAFFQQLQQAAYAETRSYMAAVLPQMATGRATCQCLLLADGSAAGPVDSETLQSLRSLVEEGEHYEKTDILELYLFPLGSDGTLYIFGAGHCGEKLSHIAPTVGFGTIVIDDRAEFANAARLPRATDILVPQRIDTPFDRLPFGMNSYIVIVTRGHVYDEQVLRRALRTTAGYIGMIGSKKKREAIYQHLLEDGYTAQDIARVHSPIGLNIMAETPEEIAVSILAELIQVRAASKTTGHT